MICFLFVSYIFFINFPFYISIWILRIVLIFHVKGLLGSGLYLFAQLCGCVVHVRITIYTINFSQSTEDNILLFHVEYRSHFHSGPRALPSVWTSALAEKTTVLWMLPSFLIHTEKKAYFIHPDIYHFCHFPFTPAVPDYPATVSLCLKFPVALLLSQVNWK